MPTIYEVAALAGVSPATVSRVMNGANVSAEKVRLVRKAAADLGFVPNRTARRLRSQTSELIALLIPDIENPFFTSLARGVEDRAQEAGFSVVLCNTDDDPAKETHYIEIAESEDMAGVILAPSPEGGNIARLVERSRPVVAVDRRTGLDIDAVLIDNTSAGTAATAALFDRGFTRVACIAGPAEFEGTEERALAWRLESTRRAGTARPDFLRHADFRVQGGREAMRELLALAEPPDAVVTTNNLMAVGALEALDDVGLDASGFGLAVVGELPFFSRRHREVFQLHLPARHLGRTAADMLLERIAGDTSPVRTVVLRPTAAA